jgi:hypothetical protein
MICLVDKDIIDPRCLSNADTPTFQRLILSSTVQSQNIVLNFLQGQHRYTWLITRWFATQLQQRNALQEELSMHIYGARETEISRNELVKIEDQLEEECVWLVSFYDQRIYIHSLSILLFYLTTIFSEIINNSSYADIIKFELSQNTQDIQKPDNVTDLLSHILRVLAPLPENQWSSTLTALANSYAHAHGDIRHILQSPSKLRFLIKLFGYSYFENASSILSPGFFNKLYRVNASVSLHILPTLCLLILKYINH